MDRARVATSPLSVASRLPVLRLALLVAVAAVVLARADDYYEILGLGEQREDAAERDIKTSWRRLSKQHHPDLVGESSRETYQRIQRAYEVLGDRKKRKVYDIRGDEGLKQLEQPQAAQHAMDPFAQIFGFGGQMGGGNNNNRGTNIQMLMLVTLEDVYNGAVHSVQLSKTKVCRACRGSGAASKEDMVVCPKCGGSGSESQRIQIAPGFFQQVQSACSQCGGKGKRIGRKCATCRGEKVIQASSELSVDIERGTPEGFDMNFEMEADQQPDQIPGDVVFSISTAPHERFTRRGDHLEMTVPLTLKEALLGFTKTFEHLDGHEVELAEAGVVQHRFVRTLEGEGMPKHHVPSEKGELRVTYEITLPQSLTSEQRERLSSLFPR